MRARTYLEIGVAKGETFLHVDVPERTGVDPRFNLDVSTITADNVKHLEMTSDAYFCQLTRDVVFDLVFVDGLHTFEQTYRDLCNVLDHTHANSVILIDDTLPVDVYSAMPDPAKALAYRTRTGDDSRAWHGDVYKVVYAIHDYHITLDYRTILGSGNPQTVVWRSPICRKPFRSSMEALARLTYFDLLDSLEILRPVSEDEAIDACLRALASP